MIPRALRAVALAAVLALPGCAGCGASDGWEKVFNPLCRAAFAPAVPALPAP
jgi:hypothetical protein